MSRVNRCRGRHDWGLVVVLPPSQNVFRFCRRRRDVEIALFLQSAVLRLWARDLQVGGVCTIMRAGCTGLSTAVLGVGMGAGCFESRPGRVGGRTHRNADLDVVRGGGSGDGESRVLKFS